MTHRGEVPAEAAEQAGVFTAAQAAAAGCSRKVRRRLLRDGRWAIVLGSVYCMASTELTPVSLAHAGVLAAGAGAVASHLTAARLWGLRVPPDPEAHVVVGRERRLTIPGLRTHRLELVDSDVALCQGVAVTTLPRTAVDCLLWLPEEAGRALAVDALRTGILDAATLRGELLRQGRRHGLARAWSVLGDVGAGAHSEGEVRLHRALRSAGLLGWTANEPVSDDAGLIGIADVLFRAARLVVEFDGRAHHSDDEAFQRDRTRQNRLVRAGFRVLRFTWDDVVARPDEVVATIRAELDRGGRGGVGVAS